MIDKMLAEHADSTIDEKVRVFNEVSTMLYQWLGIEHPCLNVQLVQADKVSSNDYNPNVVAPPEMRLLRLSIQKDGITMPVVASPNDDGGYTVVDGFHRTTVIKNDSKVRESTHGYVPIAVLDKPIDDRITATVRHNMARGTHQVELSAKLVALLRKHNWTNARIGIELGMDADEVLRLKQITGLAEAFADREFSKAWTVEQETE
jgi:ParB-like chromosome segregation protein Spo0J